MGSDEDGRKRGVEDLLDPSNPNSDRADQQTIDQTASKDVINGCARLVGCQVQHQTEIPGRCSAPDRMGDRRAVRVDTQIGRRNHQPDHRRRT